ncbi:thioredoxin domain-containing protein [Erythrobacter sp. F6033]|uniref:DsbA family protein n=1 Tax=Erythrobacter sp. F6033 TaxID=2926401 RepID=UPI001FF4A3C1|nr:thioredoxin domain-containing protein [Erythrobacter sp. F6033]MCK0127915.1 DsbA family protein [Erythrobacter sp. F6033]
MKAIFSAMALALIAAPAIAQENQLSNPDSDYVDTTSKKAWHATVERTERGHLIGNPDAEAQLIIFTSYACEGCHTFAFRGDPELDYALLAPGLLSVEIRQRINHPVDLPMSLLSQCGAPEKFKVNHSMFMRHQKKWREVWGNSGGFARTAWSRDTPAARAGLVSGLRLDDILARRRGYSRMDLNRCLTDRKAIAALRANSEADAQDFDLPTDPEGFAVPHFALDGELLQGVNSWDGLYEILAERFKPKPKSAEDELSG